MPHSDLTGLKMYDTSAAPGRKSEACMKQSAAFEDKGLLPIGGK